SHTLPSGPGKAPIPSCRPGSTVPSVSTTGGPALSLDARYWEFERRLSRTIPSRRSATGCKASFAGFPPAAWAIMLSRPPDRMTPPVGAGAAFSSDRRLDLGMGRPPSTAVIGADSSARVGVGGRGNAGNYEPAPHWADPR